MSLNGDVTVIRNGRSTSSVSIYNYPEHLNPFYEDDQHKRLRFWHVHKNGLEGKRNSFSISGLKDMWAFKSFRTKKKSSTLGINKTSESPPTLRREYQIDPNNLFNSYDRRARYSSNDNDNFQRKSPYRSSLQNMNSSLDSPGGFGLNRNDQYRSTIQFGGRTKQTVPVPQPRRYVYGGSVTPQPSRNSEFGRGYSKDILSHGSSQTSISTNPFDTDNDDEGDHSMESTSLSGVKATPRKKRRAPAPPTPTPIHTTNGISNLNVLSPESSQRSQPELRIEEDIKDIANLTAEIESFVKTKSNENPEGEIKERVPKDNPPNNELPKTNGTIPKVKPILKTSPNMVITKEFKPAPKNTELHINEYRYMEKPALPEKKKINQNQLRKNNESLGNVECIHVHVESPRSTPERDITNRVSSFKKEPNAVEKITAKTSFTLASPPNSRRDIPQNGVIKQQVKVTDTVKAVKTEGEVKAAIESNPKVNGTKIEEIKQATVKPPIAAKPDSKVKDSNFAVIHKPARHLHQNNETEKVSIPAQKTISETFIINEIYNPKETIETARKEQRAKIQNTARNDLQEPNVRVAASRTLTNKDHDAKDSTISKNEDIKNKDEENQMKKASVAVFVPVPEVRKKNLEKKHELNTKIVKEEVTVSLQPEKPSNDKKSTPPPVITINAPSDVEIEAQTLPTNSVLEIIEPKETSLRIEETPSCSSSNAVTPKPRTTLLSESREEFEALYRRPTSYAEWKHSTLAPLETPVPPQKRRSVKDIIESINRSQRLLHAAANKDLPELITTRSLPPPSYSEVVDERRESNNLSQTLKNLNDTVHEIERSITITGSNSENSTAGPSHSSNSNTNGTPDTQKPNNEEIFKKCRVNKEVYDYRETSPTASNLDWNPVPKPKRSKNLAEQREH